MKTREKQKMYRLFLSFTAITIQKNWRGYRVRRFNQKKLKIRSLAKIKIRRFVRI